MKKEYAEYLEKFNSLTEKKKNIHAYICYLYEKQGKYKNEIAALLGVTGARIGQIIPKDMKRGGQS
jgi:DNA-directed RNA polymerase specialized sigma subunit